MLLGEQPGDQEDLTGEPFVGPARRQIEACRPWLDAELDEVAPSVIVCLGGSAAQALLGSRVRVMRDHGVPVDWEGYHVVPTIHPAFVLRSSDSGRRSELFALMVDDLKKAAEWPLHGEPWSWRNPWATHPLRGMAELNCLRLSR